MITDIPKFVRDNWEVHEWRHASAVMFKDFPDEWKDLMSILTAFRLKKSWITVGGGNKSPISTGIDAEFASRGWVEKQFDTEIVVDGSRSNSPTHWIDYYKNHCAIETEWNNKDPFYDRDLNNFRLLFDLRVISVGVIITRSDELQDIFNSIGRGSSFGKNTTHMEQLLKRIEGGGGGGCPVLAFGITKKLYVEDIP